MRKKILIIAGHGQGDPGACSCWGQEMDYTRELAALVGELAKKHFIVEIYPFDKNCYKQGKAGNVVNYSEYDYVIEIHFNAKSKKDEQGDGKFTGIGGYYHPNNAANALSDKIIKNITDLGFKVWGNYTSTGLFNLNRAQQQGANYFLLETAFIDDGDDMSFYVGNKERIAESIVNTLCNFYGISTEVEAPVVGWIKQNGKWWYRHQDGSYKKNAWEHISGKWYYFDQSGWMKSNDWIKHNGAWFFVNSSGEMLENDWIKWKEKWYYLKAGGYMVANTTMVINGKKYSFAVDGHMEMTDDKGSLY